MQSSHEALNFLRWIYVCIFASHSEPTNVMMNFSIGAFKCHRRYSARAARSLGSLETKDEPSSTHLFLTSEETTL